MFAFSNRHFRNFKSINIFVLSNRHFSAFKSTLFGFEIHIVSYCSLVLFVWMKNYSTTVVTASVPVRCVDIYSKYCQFDNSCGFIHAFGMLSIIIETIYCPSKHLKEKRFVENMVTQNNTSLYNKCTEAVAPKNETILVYTYKYTETVAPKNKQSEIILL